MSMSSVASKKCRSSWPQWWLRRPESSRDINVAADTSAALEGAILRDICWSTALKKVPLCKASSACNLALPAAPRVPAVAPVSSVNGSPCLEAIWAANVVNALDCSKTCTCQAGVFDLGWFGYKGLLFWFQSFQFCWLPIHMHWHKPGRCVRRSNCWEIFGKNSESPLISTAGDAAVGLLGLTPAPVGVAFLAGDFLSRLKRLSGSYCSSSGV